MNTKNNLVRKIYEDNKDMIRHWLATGMTIKNMSKKLGIHQTTLSRYMDEDNIRSIAERGPRKRCFVKVDITNWTPKEVLILAESLRLAGVPDTTIKSIYYRYENVFR